MKKGFKNLDLPTRLLVEGADWIPARTRDPIEAERRENQRSGTLLYEQQAAGALIMQRIFDFPFRNNNDRNYAYGKISDQGLVTAWYSWARNADVMRRVLKIPALADDDAEWRESTDMLRMKTSAGLGRAATLASRITLAHRQGMDTFKLRRRFGQEIGNAAVAITCLPLADAPEDMSEFDIQQIARLTALDRLEVARDGHEEIGVHASVAQLALPETPVSIDWTRTAPESNEAYHALTQVQSDFGLAR